MGDVLIPTPLYQRLKDALQAGISGEMVFYFTQGQITSYRLTESGKEAKDGGSLDGKKNVSVLLPQGGVVPPFV